MKILKITREPNPKGDMLLRIKTESDGEILEFGAKEEDYLDDVKRESIHATIFKKLRARQAINTLPEKDRKKLKEKVDIKIAALTGTEVEDID